MPVQRPRRAIDFVSVRRGSMVACWRSPGISAAAQVPARSGSCRLSTSLRANRRDEHARLETLLANAFDLVGLTAALNKLHSRRLELPNRTVSKRGRRRPWTWAVRREINGTLQLLPPLPRNAPGTPSPASQRAASGRFGAPHSGDQQRDGRRSAERCHAFGSKYGHTFRNRVNQELPKVGARLITSIGNASCHAAIQGTDYNSNGSTNESVYRSSGVTPAIGRDGLLTS